MLTDNDVVENKVLGYVLFGLIALAFCGTYVYVFVYTAREGYSYTVATVTEICYARGARDGGYVVEYKIGGKTWKSTCFNYKPLSAIGSKYLLKYARANPEFISLLPYVLRKDDLLIPSNGWEKPPLEFFEAVPE